MIPNKYISYMTSKSATHLGLSSKRATAREKLELHLRPRQRRANHWCFVSTVYTSTGKERAIE